MFITVTPNASDQFGATYSIQLSDTYDYHIRNPFQSNKSFFYVMSMVANDFAYVAQQYGIINEYEIIVDFTLPASYLTD